MASQHAVVAEARATGPVFPHPVDETERVSVMLLSAMHDPAIAAGERRKMRAEVIERNLPFATRLARRYRHRGQEAEDLAQVASVGLVKAVDGYDPSLGKPFFGYLMPTVLGEIRRHFRDKGWTLHVGRRLQERHLEVMHSTADLTHRLGRSPGFGEIAAELGVSDTDVIEAWTAGNAYEVGSLNARVNGEDDGFERQELIAADDPDLASVCDRLALRDLLGRLPDRDRFIITRYFYGSATQEEIAHELGMSQMNISRLLRQILRRLRAGLEGRTEDAGEVSPTRSPAFTVKVTGSAARVTVVGDLDESAVRDLRDCLVDTAVRSGAQVIEVDLRHLGTADAGTVRALVDGYRAAGHSAAVLRVVNVPSTFFRLLCRLGIPRLFPCRPRTETTGEPPALGPVSTTRPRAPRRPADGAAPRHAAGLPAGSTPGTDHRCAGSSGVCRHPGGSTVRIADHPHPRPARAGRSCRFDDRRPSAHRASGRHGPSPPRGRGDPCRT